MDPVDRVDIGCPLRSGHTPNSDRGPFGDADGMPTITITVPFSNLLADGPPSTSTPLSARSFWDHIPNGVFVAFATDEAVPPRSQRRVQPDGLQLSALLASGVMTS
jgi:hypothetical protein